MSRIETVEVDDITYVVRLHEPAQGMGVMRDFMRMKNEVESAFFDTKLVFKILSRTSPQRDDGTTGKPLGAERQFNAHFRDLPPNSAASVAMEVARLNGFFELPPSLAKMTAKKAASTEEE